MNNYSFPYKIIYCNRKSICLQIIKGEVTIRVPTNLPEIKINQVINDKQHWINKKQNEYRLKTQENNLLFVNTPCRVWLMGKEYQLNDDITQDIYSINNNEIR